MARSDATKNFIEFLLKDTTHPLWVSSLPNEKGAGGERHVRTRDVEVILDFCRRWDIPGRGIFYCVSTIEGFRRSIENAAETKILWTDIDFKDVTPGQSAILKILRGLPIPPKLINASGHGLHPIWELEAPFKDDPRVLLRKLCNVLGGDPHVCHPVSLLRMPGTHNTKDGGKVLVRTLAGSGRLTQQQDFEMWLDEQKPLILRKDASAKPDDPFIAQAKVMGFAPPIDQEARLRAMRWKGPGDQAVHQTQLQVTASLLEAGLGEDEVTERVLEATQAATEGRPDWNWDREERTVRGMCASWLKKHPPKPEQTRKEKTNASAMHSLSRSVPTKANGQAGAHKKLRDTRGVNPEPGGAVVSLAVARAEREIKKAKPKNAHLVLGQGLLNALNERGEKIMYEGGQMHRYHGSAWDTYSADQEREWLGAEIQTGCVTLELVPRNGLVSEVRGWIQRCADLHCEDVPWNECNGIATKAGVIKT
jgi:hypothetical protein